MALAMKSEEKGDKKAAKRHLAKACRAAGLASGKYHFRI